MVGKRVFAYLADMYIITLSQLLFFSIYRYSIEGEFKLSILYILNNYKYLFIFIYLMYFFVFEFYFRQTLGKKIFKLEVVFKNRNILSIIIRTLVRLIPVDLFLIILKSNKTLHDLLSGTEVISKPDKNA
ncbi:RDD family protein [Chryseobacterium sp. RLHN22]|uniref:RDD family protein n=1 Tax=Chryseobacterium sp. RLHN22 TaxID=3437885 RepID=UPI003D9AEA79